MFRRITAISLLVSAVFCAPCPTTAPPCLDVITTTAPLCDIPTEAPTLPPCLADEPKKCINDGREVPCYNRPHDEQLPIKVEWKPYDDYRMSHPCEWVEYADTPVTTLAPIIDTSIQEVTCRDGWMKFENSCYFIERQMKKTLQEAEQDCLNKKATLFVANKLDEFDAIFKNTEKNEFVWTGLLLEKEDEEPRWHLPTALDYKSLPWLVMEGTPNSNGWTSNAKCATFFNGPMGYVYYYPCDWKYYYICEKNYQVNETPKKFL